MPGIIVFLLQALLMMPAWGMEFDMLTQTKCFYEELNEHVIAVVDYAAFKKDPPHSPMEVAVKVEDPRHHSLYEKYGVISGQYAFTAKFAGEYRVCFSVKDAAQAHLTKLMVDWKSGVAAKDWGSLATKEHLDDLTVQVRKLEESLQEVYDALQTLRKREEEMRDLNEDTNQRVAWFSISSLGVCIVSALWQLWYLKKFFHKKKLL